MESAKRLLKVSHIGLYSVRTRSIVQPKPPIQARPLNVEHRERVADCLADDGIDHSFPLSICFNLKEAQQWSADGKSMEPVPQDFFIADSVDTLIKKLIQHRDKLVWTVWIGSHRLAASIWLLDRSFDKMTNILHWPCNVYIYHGKTHNCCGLREWQDALFLLGSTNNKRQQLARGVTAGDVILQCHTMLEDYRQKNNNQGPSNWNDFKLKTICPFGYSLSSGDPMLQIAKYKGELWTLVERLLTANVEKSGGKNSDFKAPEHNSQLAWLAGLTDSDRKLLLEKIVLGGWTLSQAQQATKDFKIRYYIMQATYENVMQWSENFLQLKSASKYTDILGVYPVFGTGWINRWFQTFKDKQIGGRGSKKDV